MAPSVHRFVRELLDVDAQGRIGWLSPYTPIEVVWAAGFSPVKILASVQPIELACSHLPSTFSPHALSALDRALRGEFESLAGVVIGNSGVSMYRLYDAWREFASTRFVHLLDIPKTATRETIEYFARRLRELAGALGALGGRQVGESELGASIASFNRTRELLDAIHARRRRPGCPIEGGDMLRLSNAVAVAPRERVNPVLEALLAELDASPGVEGGAARPGILVTGDAFDQPELLDVVGDVGGRLVALDLPGGLPCCRGAVSTEGDPYEALARRYLTRYPCAAMACVDRRVEVLSDLIDEFGAAGIVYFAPKFSDSHLYEYPHIRKRLLERGTRSLFLEVDNILSNMEQIRTRLQAFLEILS